jgi:ribosomal protection tetracycline resistance protein
VTRRTLNLGILAHVDAGKTTLTERLLHTAGAIADVGSVDAGTTQTDTLALERARGITIRSAVATFVVDGVTVNLIDTPGHPDFIAEVERVLGVLDGAVLVVSAVEGVQPQTRALMGALRRLGVPTLLFVNKVDRTGADVGRVVQEVEQRLGVETVLLTDVRDAGRGTAASAAERHGAALEAALADALSAHDDDLLAELVDHAERLAPRRLRRELAHQTAAGEVCPVLAGSAMTGAGVPELLRQLVELLPTTGSDRADGGEVSARVFKVERGPTGERIAYVRIFSGRLAVRDTVGSRQPPRIDSERGGHRGHRGHREHHGRRDGGEKVKQLRVFDRGSWVDRHEVGPGEVARVTGLSRVRVGDDLGAGDHATGTAQFAPPTLETVVEPLHERDRGRLKAALLQLADEDPLIDVRQDERRRELAVSLYGEVQKEVIGATLATEFGVEVRFRPSTVVLVERPARSGTCLERLHSPTNPFNAWLGVRIDPLPPGSGVEVHAEVAASSTPDYLYRNLTGFEEAFREFAGATFAEGLHGWEVTDCRVTVTECVYASADGPPSTRGPMSTANDFRRLAALVLMRALEDAGTVVCEPVLAARFDVPASAAGGVVALVSRLGGRVRSQFTSGGESAIGADVPATRLQELRQLLPGLTGGEPHLETAFSHRAPVRLRRGERPPSRPRVTPDPRNLEAYLAAVGR